MSIVEYILDYKIYSLSVSKSWFDYETMDFNPFTYKNF